MDVERERRWHALVVAALEVGRPERRGHLQALGADDALIDEVLASLVAEEDTETEFLGAPAALTVPPRGESVFDTPERIGEFRILGLLGAGGMGEVFRAEQERPVHRVVALKRIQTHLPAEARLRFEGEQQALARLSHGCIARLYDAGTTDDGRPWFSMELVDGAPITAYCDEHSLAIDRRIGLFLGVCSGIEHAHRRQILHRDLKPSNVLVTEEDGRPVPKIIDFGIAKLLDASVEASLLQTEGGLLGTPAYTSPEALFDSGDVDTRTDVYSLGILLFELLVGHRPFERERPALGELLRRVREEDPETPSGLLRRLPAEKAEALALCRSTSAAALRRVVDGDLRWIVARAMERERERRYGSVRELADDLRRYLADEPVTARPPSRSYRLRKLMRRQRKAVAAALVATLGLAAGAVGLAVGLVRARAEAVNAQAALAEAEEVSDFLVGLFREADPTSTDGEELTVLDLLDRGSAQIRDRFIDQPAVRGRLLQTLAEVQLERGLNDRAEPMLREAAELFETALPPGDPARASVQGSFGVLYSQRRDWVHAEEAFRRALAEMGEDTEPEIRALARHNLGVAVMFQVRLDEAEDHFRAALDERRRHLPPNHPHLARSFNALGAVLVRKGRPEEALQFIEASVEHREESLGPDHPDLAKALVNLAAAERQLALYEDAVAHARRAAEIEERALGASHPDLGTTLQSLAENLAALGRHDEAVPVWGRVVAIRYDSVPGSRSLARALSGQAESLLEIGRVEDAEAAYLEIDRIYETTAAPDDPVRAIPRVGLALVAWQRGDLDRAEAEIREAQKPAAVTSRQEVTVRTARILAGVARDRGRLQEAEDLYARALEAAPEDGAAARAQARLRTDYADLLRSTGRAAKAVEVLRAGSP